MKELAACAAARRRRWRPLLRPPCRRAVVPPCPAAGAAATAALGQVTAAAAIASFRGGSLGSNEKWDLRLIKTAEVVLLQYLTSMLGSCRSGFSCMDFGLGIAQWGQNICDVALIHCITIYYALKNGHFEQSAILNLIFQRFFFFLLYPHQN